MQSKEYPAFLSCFRCGTTYNMLKITKMEQFRYKKYLFDNQECILCKESLSTSGVIETATPIKIVEKRITGVNEIKEVIASSQGENRYLLVEQLKMVAKDLEKKIIQDVSDMIASFKEECNEDLLKRKEKRTE